MKAITLSTLSAALLVLVIACSGSESTPESSTSPNNPPPSSSGNNGSSGNAGSSGSSGSSGASGTSGTSGSSGQTALDAGKDSSKVDVACGKPGDTGNSKGVGKYCTGILDCLGNKDAQLCATAGDPKATFCTKLCNKGEGESVCGEAADCVCDPGGGGQCGCTPKACL